MAKLASPSNQVKIKYQRVLDAYFATRSEEVQYEKGTGKTHTVKSGDTLGRIAKNNSTTVAQLKKDNKLTSDLIQIGQKLTLSTKKVKGKKVSFKPLSSANIGDEVYVVVTTDAIGEGKKVWLSVCQGKADGVVKEKESIALLIDDKETHRPEAVIGALSNDSEITNADDFKDWAVFTFKLGGKEPKEYTDALDRLEGKKTNLFLIVDAHQPNDLKIVYNGTNPDKNGKPDRRTTPNHWLDIDGKWFQFSAKDCCTQDLTKETIKKIATHAKDSNITKHLKGLNESFNDNKINTCLRRIHYLAQLIHESGSFHYTEELGASETDYGGFKGRGLIQLTFKSNYESYGKFVGEDVTSSQANKEKLESDPHAAKSAGWFWGQKAKLNDEADKNDLIYISYRVNGGFNGYEDRLKYVKKGFEVLYTSCSKKTTEKAEYAFSDSEAYDSQKASFGWGLWHDPDLTKKGCTKSKTKAIEGYERFISLHDAAGKKSLTKKWYGYKGSTIRSTVEERLKKLKPTS